MAGPRRSNLLGGRRRRQVSLVGLFPFGNPRRMGPLGLVPLAHVGQGAPPTAHVAPPGLVDPRTPLALPVQYR